MSYKPDFQLLAEITAELRSIVANSVAENNLSLRCSINRSFLLTRSELAVDRTHTIIVVGGMPRILLQSNRNQLTS